MTIVVTDQDIQDLIDQSQQQGKPLYYDTEFGAQGHIPKQFGEGGDRFFFLRGGLTIDIFSRQFWQPVIVEHSHPATFPVVAKFCLDGGYRVKTNNAPEIAADYEEVAGCNYLYHLPELIESEEYPSHTHIQTVMVYAHIDYFRTLDPSNYDLPYPLERLIQGSGRFHQSLGKTTLAMTQVLQQILHCPYQGTAKLLYLESKALELLSLQFALLEIDPSTPNLAPFKASDLDKVQSARNILVQRLKNPPSLTELTYQVGLSNRKLNQGFRHLFGKTVSGYLYDYRMEQAQQLLHGSYTSIADVAAQVGYRNPEAFSTAFRRKFSVSPKAYQLKQRQRRLQKV